MGRILACWRDNYVICFFENGFSLLKYKGMLSRENHGNVLLRLIVLLLIFFVLVIFIVNHLINQKTKELTVQKKQNIAVQASSWARTRSNFAADHALMEEQAEPSDVVRKSRVERGMDMVENIFYRGPNEIARESISGGKTQLVGTIPDGLVKFEDSYSKTHGEEHYLGGKKHGESKEYNPNGGLKSKKYYLLGVLQTTKDYYADGTLLFEGDYRNTVYAPGEAELGIGKLYYLNGVLKYEWQFTNDIPVRFRKSYNVDGTLRAATYYDETNKIIKQEAY